MKKEQQDSVYDLSLVEARDKVLKAARDASAMADAIPGELGKWARLWHWVAGWWRAPRSRIGLALAVCACLLAQGCATAAWHNYQVAEAERSEREQIEAGLIPLVKTNGDIIRDNWAGYVGGAVLDGVLAYCVYKYVERDDEDTTVNNSTTINNPPPDPIAEEPQGQTGEE